MIEQAYRTVDIEQWNRREIYEYFIDCDEPFHGVTVPIDMTHVKKKAVSTGISIFHLYMFHFLQTLNESRPFKLRLLGNEVIEFHEIHSGITIMKDNGTFAYGHIFPQSTIADFTQHMQEEKERVQARGTLKDKEFRLDMIHFSVLPWTYFSGLSHARRYGTEDSIPKITFGQIKQFGDQWTMPMSIHVHHALVDGKDVSHFVQLFQEKLISI